jgi:hypothetical protein
MIKVQTKNGVELFITLCDDCGNNKGGYYCEVSLDENGVFEYDNFVIHKEDLECCENKDEYIQICCEEYAKNVDDMPILNKEFNEVYDKISDAYDKVNEFYLKYIFFNKRCNPLHRQEVADLLDKIGNVKEIGHEIAEHYTWDY